MAKDIDPQEFETGAASTIAVKPIAPDATSDSVEAAGATVGAASVRPLWQPTEPQYCKSIAAHYGINGRTVQRVYQKIVESCPWIPEADLRLPDQRYTPLCVVLMGQYWQSGLKIDAWKTQMWESHPEQVRAYLESQSTHPESGSANVQPDVLPPLPGNDCSVGMTLHIGSALNLPEIDRFVIPSDDPAYLSQAEQKLLQFEQKQQNVIAQMYEQFQQTQALNAQFKEGLSLSDQLLLKEFQLRGVQIGFQAVQLKQEAIKATIQSAEAGTLPMPGKPQSENTPTLSA